MMSFRSTCSWMLKRARKKQTRIKESFIEGKAYDKSTPSPMQRNPPKTPPWGSFFLIKRMKAKKLSLNALAFTRSFPSLKIIQRLMDWVSRNKRKAEINWSSHSIQSRPMTFPLLELPNLPSIVRTLMATILTPKSRGNPTQKSPG